MRSSVFSKVFSRGSTQGISLLKWMKLTLLESYLGEQVIDIILSVSSYQTKSVSWKGGDQAVGGYRGELEFFIPSTFINKLLKPHILELLEIKYFQHYEVLEKGETKENQHLYSANPHNLPVLSELKLSYNTIWVAINVTVDVMVYLVTSDISAALVSGAVIEFIRRFKI
ncbi:TPA: hypothetical protein NJ348_004454 [Vibrio parahaemolyticus]|nr:hypothetical protein [Vibrio parahaemolyticus]TBT28598.1 hypothetical protein D5E85_24805 [Vibrio parahaemolyticus]HCG7147259.1 hypothetical protein [Vibrio parahaemolyticus]